MNLDIRNITDNKRFWRTMKPLFNDKSSFNQVNNLLIDGKIVNKDDEIAQNRNNYFANAVKSLDIQENWYLLTENKNIDDEIGIS